MARPIIGGPDTAKPQVPRAAGGGVMPVKPTSYSPPKGPSGQMHCGPGLGGANYGNGQMPRPSGEGKTSIPGSTMRNGSQR